MIAIVSGKIGMFREVYAAEKMRQLFTIFFIGRSAVPVPLITTNCQTLSYLTKGMHKEKIEFSIV